MQVLHQLPVQRDKDLLVGVETADDAGVYRISDDKAVISTLDFFPPIVDDPYTFGQIAAANALSDVYAMGGTPRLAMNIVCFPKELPISVLDEILKGSMDKLSEAGALLVGGHSIEDSQVKYGLSVNGFVNPKDLKTNAGARPGDALILTKPIGVGVITSALKAGRIELDEAVEAIESMKALNKTASALMVEVGANACTDVTGYGLLGHAMEMAKGSDVSLVIQRGGVKVFKGALELVSKKNCRPRSIQTTREFLEGDVSLAQMSEAEEMILYDPQTSGGLLISIPEDRAPSLMERLRACQINASIIGRVVEKERVRIRVE